MTRSEPPPSAAPSPSPAREPTAAATAAPAQAAAVRPSNGWAQAVSAWLASHKHYPPEARRRGEEGNVTLRFTVTPSGAVTAVTLVHGSGSLRLDDAAEAMLHGAALPPFDSSMSPLPVTLTVRIHYALED